MGEKILLLLIGWGLGFFSKFIWDRKYQKRSQEKEDRNILVQVIEVLSDFMGVVESGKSKRTSIENFNELDKLRLMIQCKENEDLAGEIQSFIQENRKYDPLSYPALREKINLLKTKVEERLKKGSQ